MATEWREAFCPECGRTMGMLNITPKGKRYVKLGQVNRWEQTQDFTGEKPFGVIKSSAGARSMKTVRYYDIDEDAEGFFGFMKKRLLNVIREWLAKGWLTVDELAEVIEE